MDIQLIIVIVVIGLAVAWVLWQLVKSLSQRHDDDLSCPCSQGSKHRRKAPARQHSILDQCDNCPVWHQCDKKNDLAH